MHDNLSSDVLTTVKNKALYQLHWFPVKQRIHFKIATLTYRDLQSGSPSYLSSLINLNNPPGPLFCLTQSVTCSFHCQGHRSQSLQVHSSYDFELYSTKYQVTTIHWFFQTQSQNSPLFSPRLAMFPTLLYASASDSSSLEFVRYINSVIIIIIFFVFFNRAFIALQRSNIVLMNMKLSIEYNSDVVCVVGSKNVGGTQSSDQFAVLC